MGGGCSEDILELLHQLFLHAHRETTRSFEIFEDGHAQPHTPRFQYRRAALKIKTDCHIDSASATALPIQFT